MLDLAQSSPLLLCLVVVAVAAAGSLLPVSPTEPMLLALGAAAPPELLVPIALLASVGSMGAKTLVFVGGRFASRAIPASKRAWLERIVARVEGRRWHQRLLLLVSSATGLPPFYVLTGLLGSVRFPLREYLIAGTAGRALRFGALLCLPRLVGALS